MATRNTTYRVPRVMRATNATATEVDGQIEPSESPSATTQTPKTYHSTGIQTLPLFESRKFQEIFGRSPGPTELGAAAIGRYECVNGRAEAYKHEYGPAFAPSAASEPGPKYVDSTFQTVDYLEAKRSITKAKVKATMMAGKYRKVAEDAGVRVFAEPNADLIIHSEQFMPRVTLDADGNTPDGDLGSLFLPNIYGEDIRTPLLSTPTSPPTPSPRSQSSSISQTLHAIPSLAPSQREDVPNPDSKEDYGEEFIEEKWVAEYQARFLKEGGRGDGVPPPAFVVFDPAWCPSPVRRFNKTLHTSSSSKRKRSTEDDRHPSDTPTKRTRRSVSPTPTENQYSNSDREIHRGRHTARHHQERSRSRATSSSSGDYHTPPIEMPKPQVDDTYRGHSRDYERNPTASVRKPRERSTSPRRNDRDRRYRSRSPVDHQDVSYRKRHDSSDSDSSREHHRRSRDHRSRRESRAAEPQRKARTPAVEQAQRRPNAPVEKACATPNTHGSHQEHHAPRGQSHEHQVTPTPAPRAQRQSKAIGRELRAHHSDRERTPASRPPNEQQSNQPPPTTHRASRTLVEHDAPKQETGTTKRNTNITQATMQEARRAEDRRGELAHKPAAAPSPTRPRTDRILSGRVEKTQRTPSRREVEKETVKKAEKEAVRKTEKKIPAPERKPPTGPRPRRDARSLINSWLGA